ncbi:MAG: hypothetical protein JSR80_00450 [Verrucomicrobia bacterium]|nr:hypothetical protein [Verrucomicrobiota bacterium]
MFSGIRSMFSIKSEAQLSQEEKKLSLTEGQLSNLQLAFQEKKNLFSSFQSTVFQGIVFNSSEISSIELKILEIDNLQKRDPNSSFQMKSALKPFTN